MQSSRPHNRRLVLEAIRRSGPLSRSDLARETGLTNQSVTNLVELLVAEGLVLETGRRTPTRGQPPRDLALRPEGALAVGFHLDRRSWSWAVTDLAGGLLAQESGGFDPGTTSAELTPLWSLAWARLRAGFGPEAPFCGVGVAGPGPQDAQGVLRSPPDFPGWDGVDLKALVGALTGLEVWVENDARAAAVGELWAGWGRSHPDFLYLYCSWAFGLGVVLDGTLRSGTRGLAGEASAFLPWQRNPGFTPEKARQLGVSLGLVVRALDIGAVVLGGSWSKLDLRYLSEALAADWPGVPVLVSQLEDAAVVGAATLALTRRFEAS